MKEETEYLQSYGFNFHCQLLTYEDYGGSIMSSKPEVIKHIQSLSFKEGIEREEALFMRLFMQEVFWYVKIKAKLDDVIDRWKDMVNQVKGISIWSSKQTKEPKTDAEFLISYILNNSTPLLKRCISYSLKYEVPLPLYLSQMKLQVLNQQLSSLIKSNLTLSAISLSQTSQISKRFKLNTYLKTNFHLNDRQTVPYLHIPFYQSIYPINIIDIPFIFDSELKRQVIDHSEIVFIYSEQTTQATLQKMEEMRFQKDKPIIVLIDGMKKTQILKKISTPVRMFVELRKKKALKEDPMEDHEIGLQIWMFLNNQQNRFKEKTKLSDLFNKTQQHSQFYQILSSIKSNMLGLCYFSASKDEFVRGDHELALPIQELLKYLSFVSQEERKELIMIFDSEMRAYKEQLIEKNNAIYDIQRQLWKNNNTKGLKKGKSPTSCNFDRLDDMLISLKIANPDKLTLKDSPPTERSNLISSLIRQYEKNKDMFLFSIEMFWRELETVLDNREKSADMSEKLFSICKVVRNYETTMYKSFELLRGNNLRTNRFILNDLTEDNKGRCLVISVIGPVSSGKSSLMNNLFGCQFPTGVGYLTKGILGMYSPLCQFAANSNISFNSLLLLDCEGLFALGSDREDNFNQKMTLFNLITSDFMIYHSRGPINHYSQQLLQETVSLCQSSDVKIGDLILTEDQNEMEDQRQDHNIAFKVYKELPTSYYVEEYCKIQLPFLQQSKNITKRTIQPIYLDAIRSLRDEIYELAVQKSNYQSISHKIKLFDLVWKSLSESKELSSSLKEIHQKIGCLDGLKLDK